MIYLPRIATVEQAEEYLSQKTGEAWPLSRLIEYGMVPYFWLDYTDESAALFDGKREGFLVRMLFQPDLNRLEACPDEVLVQIFARPDDSLVKADPPFLIPTTELRFMREDLYELVSQNTKPATAENGKAIRWTKEIKAEAQAYRDKHGLKATAVQYKVSQTIISRNTESRKKKEKPNTVWSGWRADS